MKIHSSIITESQIRDAVPVSCYLAGHYAQGSEQWSSVHALGSRSHSRAFSVRLSGSSPYAMQRIPDKAATWDEWGIFLDRLFSIDPDAICGWYKGREDFITKTRDEHERVTRWHDEKRRATHTAPWLAAVA